MDNIKLISTHQHRPMTDGITCIDTVDSDVTYYEVVNPHWIADLNARGLEGIAALKIWAWYHLIDHDGINTVRVQDGKYIIEAIDL